MTIILALDSSILSRPHFPHDDEGAVSATANSARAVLGDTPPQWIASSLRQIFYVSTFTALHLHSRFSDWIVVRGINPIIITEMFDRNCEFQTFGDTILLFLFHVVFVRETQRETASLHPGDLFLLTCSERRLSNVDHNIIWHYYGIIV